MANQPLAQPIISFIPIVTYKMKTYSQLIIIMILQFVFQLSYGQQERIITGQILGQGLIELPGMLIMTSDSKVLDTTDFNGRFKFKHTGDNKKIKFVSAMFQQEEIELSKNCNHIEIIILEECIYDFISIKRADRKKKRDRKRMLHKLYAEAYEKGLFDNENPCR